MNHLMTDYSMNGASTRISNPAQLTADMHFAGRMPWGSSITACGQGDSIPVVAHASLHCAVSCIVRALRPVARADAPLP